MFFARKKICCDDFKYRYEGSSSMGLNIRIIKLTEEEVMKKEDLENPFRFFITEGYEKGEVAIKRILIDYCPFCGSRLADFYAKDDFVNETDHGFIGF